MSKSIKILSFTLIVFSLLFSFCGVYATDINMNLASNENNEYNNNTFGTNETNETNNNINTNTVTNDEQIFDSTSMLQEESNADDIATPSNVGSIEEEGLGLSNFLRIILITVGVVLILLSIAILIRLK